MWPFHLVVGCMNKCKFFHEFCVEPN